MTLNLALTILATVLTISGGLGLVVVLFFWPGSEAPHRWQMAGGMTLAIWAAFGLARHIPALSPLGREPTAYLTLSGATLTPIMFYAYVRHQDPPEDRYARALIRLTPALATGFVLLLWLDQAVELSADPDSLRYRLLPLGWIGLGGAVIYALIPFLLLRMKHHHYDQWLAYATLALAGATGAHLIPPLQGGPLPFVLTALATGMAGFALLRFQWILPFTQLEEELRAANSELRAAINDLGSEKVTAQRTISELRAANRTKNEFLTNMSHALRTPLSSILGYGQLLVNNIYGELNEQQADRAGKIHRNSQHLLALLNDILDLSRIEGERMELAIETVRVSAILNALCTEAEAQAAEKNLTITCDRATPLRLIRADQTRVQQIIHNLLRHAIQQSPNGATIQLRAHNVTVRNGQSSDVALPTLGWLEDRHWLLISVQDTGPGIPPEEQALIFEAFRQTGEPARQEQVDGEGLTLVVAKRLVELHAGRIWVRSQPGEGSTFLVALPAQETFEDTVVSG